MREIVIKMKKPKERVEESTRKWEEVNEDIFVNKESWEHRLARYQKARKKLQEIMDKGD